VRVVPRNLIGYVRVAPRERATERPSMDDQRAAIAAAVDRRGDRLIGVEEDVRSGRTLRRPGLRAAIAACRAGDADGILVARLDRLTYSVTDLAELVKGAVGDGYTLIALDPEMDLEAAGGRTVAEVLATAASWQPAPISKPGRAMARRAGRPSSVPAAVAQRIRVLRAEGMTLQAICDTLNAEGVPTPRGGREWRPTSLRAVLRTRPAEAPGGGGRGGLSLSSQEAPAGADSESLVRP
jgi:DNA invertase Pin-like site-specific DNA recombinase